MTLLMIEPRTSSVHRLRRVAPRTICVAFSTRAACTSALATSTATCLDVAAADLLEQLTMLVEAVVRRAGQPVADYDVDADELAARSPRHARRPADEVVAAWRAGQRDEHPLLGLPRPLDAVTDAVVVQLLVDTVGDPEQRELPERGEVADAEVVAERGVDLLGAVDVAVRHAPAQRLGRHVDELDLVGRPDDCVGHRLALLDAGDPLDDVVQRLEVLDVDRGDDVDAGVEQLVDVLPALLVAGAGHVGVRELVDERPRRAAGRGWRRRPSPRTPGRGSGASSGARTSRSRICAAVFGRPCVSTKPTTTSVPRSWRRQPSLSMAYVLPTPGAAPR